MPLDPVLVADTRAWPRKVSVDLRSAEVDLSAEPPIPEDALFHSQQAVEKALKAYLTWRQHPFGKTHDLRVLAKACTALDPSLETQLAEAAPLTVYAWRFRYPGVDEAPEAAEASEALSIAKQTVAIVRSRLPAEVTADSF